MVRAVTYLTGVGLLGNPSRLEIEEGGSGRDRTMHMVEMDGPQPNGGEGV